MHGTTVALSSRVLAHDGVLRSDTPLIRKTVDSWFIKVEQIKSQLLANNKSTYVPI